MRTTTHPNHLSGPELRRQSAEAFAPLFSHRRHVTEASRPAEYVAATSDNRTSPPTESGAIASKPFACPKCGTKATLHTPAKFCLRCGTPTAAPAESVRDDDPRRVHEDAKPATNRVPASTLAELRRAVGDRFPFTPKPSPLTAASLRADMETLASLPMRQRAAEKSALDRLAKS